MTDRDFHEEEALGKAYDARLMRRLLTYLRPHRGTVAISVVLLVATSILELAGPFLTKLAIDRTIETRDTHGLLVICGIYFATLVMVMLLGYAQIYLMQMVGQKIMLKLREEIFGHLSRLHVAYYDRNPVGRLITRLTGDVEALNEMFTSGVVAIFGDVIMLVGIMGMLLVLNWKLALVTFAVLPFLFMLSLWFRRNVRETYRDVRIRLARINAFLQEAISGMSILQIMGHERHSREEFADYNRTHTEAHLRSVFYYATFYPGVEFFSALALAAVIWFGGINILEGAFTLGGLVAFIQYVRRFYRPIQDLSEKYNILQGAMASSERIFELLDTETLVVPPTDPVHPRPSPDVPSVSFENVWFAYKDEDWILRDVSFAVGTGESLAFVGHTGAGKTTIMNLLLRFYDVQRGHVRVDGVDVREWDPRALRRRMSLVLQDVFLFRGTVAENVRLGTEGIGDDDVAEAARNVNAHRFVERLEEGYGAEVGERGASLSTGQKQLLSFARALAHEPDILILDEATSNVDTETESLIQDALTRLMKGRTSLIVAHRLSTVRGVDRIVVLHKGQVRETGTHAELLKLGGLYSKLYQLQYKDQEALASPAPPAAAS